MLKRASREEVTMSSENEVEMALAALRELAQKVTSPVIRSCLEAARDDIVHLVGGGEDADHDSDSAADGAPRSTP
jgi:hypothetical protein